MLLQPARRHGSRTDARKRAQIRYEPKESHQRTAWLSDLKHSLLTSFGLAVERSCHKFEEASTSSQQGNSAVYCTYGMGRTA